MSNQNTVSTRTAPDPKHFEYIDAVRGWAFLAVLTLHSQLIVGPFLGKELLKGGYGVQLFFLASAITLCNSMAARQQKDKFPIFFFYLRRLFRIAPLFWCAIIFYWVFPNVTPSYWLSQWAPNGVHPSYFILTALFLHGWHPLTFNSIVPGGWSIAVEMTFYLFFPLLFRLLNSPKRVTIVVLLAVFYGVLANTGTIHSDSIDARLRNHFYPNIPDTIWDFFINFWFPSSLYVFLIGFLAYHLLKRASVKGFAKDRFGVTCLFCFCVMLLTSFFRAESGFVPTPLLIVSAMAGIIIAMSGQVLRWLVNFFICYIGRISYSCYLVHFAALGVTLRLFGIHLTNEMQSFNAGGSFSNLFLFVKIWVVALGLTAVISTITLHLIENPGIALGRKLIDWITSLSARPDLTLSKA